MVTCIASLKVLTCLCSPHSTSRSSSSPPSRTTVAPQSSQEPCCGPNEAAARQRHSFPLTPPPAPLPGPQHLAVPGCPESPVGFDLPRSPGPQGVWSGSDFSQIFQFFLWRINFPSLPHSYEIFVLQYTLILLFSQCLYFPKWLAELKPESSQGFSLLHEKSKFKKEKLETNNYIKVQNEMVESMWAVWRKESDIQTPLKTDWISTRGGDEGRAFWNGTKASLWEKLI